MIAYVVRRVLFGISLLLGISFASFAAFGLSLDPTYPLVPAISRARTSIRWCGTQPP